MNVVEKGAGLGVEAWGRFISGNIVLGVFGFLDGFR